VLKKGVFTWNQTAFCELRDIFLRKTGTDIYSPQALRSSSSEKKNGCRSRFWVLAEKQDKKSLTISQLAVSSFLPLKRAGGNEKIARFHHRVRSSEE